MCMPCLLCTAAQSFDNIQHTERRQAPGDELIQELSADRTVWELLQIIVGSADDTRALTEVPFAHFACTIHLEYKMCSAASDTGD